MRWIIIGAQGMLGHDLVTRVRSGGHEVIALDRNDVDITNTKSVSESVRDIDILANVAAFTAVDAAEEQEANAFAVNATGAQILARRCKEIGARMVHVSTDYVFGGDATSPYAEDDVMEPRSAYGRTKAAGEWAVRVNADDYLIVRTAWLYGKFGKSFPDTMRNLAQTHDTLQVVTDEYGQPTWTVDLADLIVRLVEAKAPTGIYHGTASGKTNWFNFTRAIMETIGKDPAMVHETTAAAFDRLAPRPHYSVLGHAALEAIGVAPIGDWRARWKEAATVMWS